MSRAKVRFIVDHLTPYNRHLFNALAADNRVELEVYFLDLVEDTHPWQQIGEVRFNFTICRRKLGVDWHILRQVRNSDAFFIVAGWGTATYAALIYRLGVLGKQFAIWTDTPNTSRRRPFIKEHLRRAWLRWIFARASYVLATGAPGIARLREMGCASEKMVNFPFVVDLNVYAPSTYTIGPAASSGRPLTFVSAGRLCNATKGTSIGLLALSRVAASRPNFRFIYQVAGTGPDREKLERMSESLGLSGKVEFLGWVESDRLAKVLREADVLIHPSHYDPFPVTILEGMAAGLLVLASDACGSALDRIRHGENGLIHRAGDAEQLSCQLAGLADEPQTIRLMGAAARRTAESWPAARVVQILIDLVSRRDSRPLDGRT